VRTILFVIVIFAAAITTHAQLPKSYVCYRASEPITIDGSLSDPAWSNASWTDDFVDIEGDKKPTPRFQTRIKMLWDDQCFYVAADLQEPHVWATIAKRDDVIFHDNDFEIFMDPDGDNFAYGEFEINALNTGWDLFLPKPYKDGGHADDSWNITGIKTAVWINGTLNNPADTDRGWSVEIAMPWASLERISQTTKSPKDSQQWHINFSRVEWTIDTTDGKYRKIAGKPEDNWVWSPQGVIDMHRPEMWGIMQFSTKVLDTESVRPDPFTEARRALHKIYYAEKDYHLQHKKWCIKLKDLHLVLPPLQFRIELSHEGYVAYVLSLPGRPSIREDSHFTIEPAITKMKRRP
jgi:hypothetical protein